jgi:hypothetical protein
MPGPGVTTLIQRLAELSADGFQSLASDCRSEPGEICCDGRVDHALQDVADHRQIASAGMWGAHDGWSPNLGPRRRFLMVVAGVLDASMLRYFLIAFDLTLMMAAPAAAAADLVIDGVPLPSDASVASVPTSAMDLQRRRVGRGMGWHPQACLAGRTYRRGWRSRRYTPGRRRGGGDWTRLCPDKRLP